MNRTENNRKLLSRATEIADEVGVRGVLFEVSYRLKTTAALAYYEEHRIKLNGNLFSIPENFDKCFRNTVLHELAHVMLKRPGHGRDWKQVARSIGCTAVRCHSMDTSAFSKPRKPMPMQRGRCVDCGKVVSVRWGRWVRMKNGTRHYKHVNCGGKVFAVFPEIR